MVCSSQADIVREQVKGFDAARVNRLCSHLRDWDGALKEAPASECLCFFLFSIFLLFSYNAAVVLCSFRG